MSGRSGERSRGEVVEEARLQFLPDCPIFSNIFSNQYFKVIGLQNT